MKEGEHVSHTKGDFEPIKDTSGLKAPSIDHIKELRERLYARGNVPTRSVRHDLTERQIHQEMEAPSQIAYNEPRSVTVEQSSKILPVEKEVQEPVSIVHTTPVMPSTSKRKSIRKKVLLGGLCFFVLALIVSSISMFWGNNTISGENISITTSGPIAVGAGEELSFQVSVANQNTIPIQSATLIIEYPRGTQSATEVGKELLIVRQPLDAIGTGELVNIPIKARIFGEENEEKEIKVSIDYRISGSNATFQKESTPLRFKVSTSPVVMTFDSIKTISSGQEFELKLIVQSNSPSPLSNILIKTTYPEGFDFSSAKPDTVSGEDTWKITTLKPNEKQTIVIKGLLTGAEDAGRRFGATAGVASEEDRNTLASQLATANTEVIIEQPFLDVSMSINDTQSETVVVNADNPAQIEVLYKNSLDTTIYDGSVLLELAGNALNEFDVRPSRGFYDSSNNTVRWDSVDAPELKEVLPGRVVRLSVTVTPKDSIGSAPELTMKATAKGQRVFENRVPQELIGTVERTIKIQSITIVDAQVLHSSGPFTNTGPIPPVAEKVTQYTYTITVKTGSNDVTGAEVTAVLPSYVSWLDLVSQGDAVTYNATTRTLRWNIGDIKANTEESVSMQVSLRPSLSQIGKIPTLLETQRFKATDRFTGTVVRAEHAAVTTELLGEATDELKDGRVREEE